MTTADYILEQLGGSEFVKASKAKQLAEIPDGLLVKLPDTLHGRAYLKITRESSGKYNLDLYRPDRYSREHIALATVEAVYEDELATTVERLVGISLNRKTLSSSLIRRAIAL